MYRVPSHPTHVSDTSSDESVQLHSLIKSYSSNLDPPPPPPPPAPPLDTHNFSAPSTIPQIHLHNHFVISPCNGQFLPAMPVFYPGNVQFSTSNSYQTDVQVTSVASDCNYQYGDLGGGITGDFSTMTNSYMSTAKPPPREMGYASNGEDAKAIPLCLDSLLSTRIQGEQESITVDKSSDDTAAEDETWSNPPSLPSLQDDDLYPQVVSTMYDSTIYTGSGTLDVFTGVTGSFPPSIDESSIPAVNPNPSAADCYLLPDQDKYNRVVIAKQQACLLKLRSKMQHDESKLVQVRGEVYHMERELSKLDQTKSSAELEKACNMALAELRQLRTEVQELTHQVDMIKLPLGVVEPDELRSFYVSLDEKTSSGELSSLEAGACGGSGPIKDERRSNATSCSNSAYMKTDTPSGSNSANIRPNATSGSNSPGPKPDRPSQLNVKETSSADEPLMCDISPLFYDEACGHNRWSCGRCTFLNHEELHVCEMCSTQRVPAQPIDPNLDPLQRTVSVPLSSSRPTRSPIPNRPSRGTSLPAAADISGLETFEPNDEDDDTVVIFHKSESSEFSKSLR